MRYEDVVCFAYHSSLSHIDGLHPLTSSFSRLACEHFRSLLSVSSSSHRMSRKRSEQDREIPRVFPVAVEATLAEQQPIVVAHIISYISGQLRITVPSRRPPSFS